MTPKPQASVIIPTLNSAPALAIQLDSLLRQDYEGAFEILVIDNGSTDETRELLEDYYPRFAFRQVNLRYFISDTPATWVSAMQTVKSYCFATPTTCFPTTGSAKALNL